jgi:hypothetical protein
MEENRLVLDELSEVLRAVPIAEFGFSRVSAGFLAAVSLDFVEKDWRADSGGRLSASPTGDAMIREADGPTAALICLQISTSTAFCSANVRLSSGFDVDFS